MLRLIIVLSILALGACATTAPPVAPPTAAPPPAAAQALTPVGEIRAQTGDVMTLYADPCPPEIRALYPALRPDLQRAGLRMTDGRTYTGCYGISAGRVMSVWDDGEYIEIPVHFVRPVSGQSAPRRGRLDA